VNRIYAPWRAAYLMQDHKPEPDCLFCAIGGASDDLANLVLARAGHWYLIINRFPTTGHIMVVCNRHVESFSELDGDESAEFPQVLARGERAVHEAYRPDGINVGANLGRSAGAGIVGHLHVHVVPRWHGDTNFMSAIGDTRVVSEDLSETYERIKAALERI
jgi:ATP adenylyltransferase